MSVQLLPLLRQLGPAVVLLGIDAISARADDKPKPPATDPPSAAEHPLLSALQ